MLRATAPLLPFMEPSQSRMQLRCFSTESHLQVRWPMHSASGKAAMRKQSEADSKSDPPPPPKLTHLNESGSAQMVDISKKAPTARVARAQASLHFSNPTAAKLIAENGMKKGDVLGVARIAGIMAAKKCSDLIPLCHPIMLTKVAVECKLVAEDFGRVEIVATVQCDGKTGVEMEALTAATIAALTVYDMCKAVDKRMRIDNARVVQKKGGKSGEWSSE